VSVELSPYPEYKDSGIEWLGEIPAHWETKSLRRVARVQLSNVDKHTLDGEVAVKLCNYTDVYHRSFITSDIEFMDVSALPREIEKFGLRAGDVMVTKDSESWMDIAVPAFVPKDLPGVLCGYHLAHIRPKPAVIEGSYLFRAFESETLNRQFRVAANGVTRFGISKPDIAAGIFLLPSLEEQRQIARYLDRLDSLANRLIQTKQQLIELLNEQKQAIIHNAVTRGLDPDAPMKPTGLDWMPEVPEHWEMKLLKQVSKVRLSGVDKHSIEGEQPVLLCNYTDVYNNESITPEIDFMNATATDAEIEAFALAEGDVLITKDSEASDDIAVPALVHAGLDGVICGYHLAMLRPDASSIVGEYLFLALSEVSVSRQFHVAATGVTRFGISKQDIKNAIVPLPPRNEQSEICRWLAEESKTIDAAVRRARSEIDLIGEYRTRLVSDVVTGKLDVRGVELPEVEEIEDAPGVEETLLSGFADFAEESHIAP
jgi:type I restriction enzyme, S subunit